MSEIQIEKYQEYLQDLESMLNDAIKSREDAKELTKHIRTIIKLLFKEIKIIIKEATNDEIIKLKQLLNRVRQIYNDKLESINGYIIGILYHLQAYRDINLIIESKYSKSIDPSLFINEEDLGIFGYYYGLTKIKLGDYRQAANALDYAYLVCKEEQRKELLMYLIPLKLRIGKYPSKYMINKYQSIFLKDLCDCVSRGDIGMFENLLIEYSIDLFRIGMYEVIQSLRLIVYRNLIEKIVKIKQVYKFHIDVLVNVINSLIKDENMKVDTMTVINVLMNMICNGIIVGKLVISMNAFTMSAQNGLQFYSD